MDEMFLTAACLISAFLLPPQEWHIGVIDAAEVGGFQTTSRLAHTLSAWEATGW